MLLNRPRSRQRTEDRFFDGRGSGKTDVTATVAQSDALYAASILIEGFDVITAGCPVKNNLKLGTALGVNQVKLPVPGRLPVFVGPHVNQNQLMTEVGQELKRTLTTGLVQKIGDDDQQSTLRINGDELTRDFKIISLTGRLQVLQEGHRRNESMAATSTQEGIAQVLAERLNAHGIEPHQPDIAQRRSQPASIVELRDFAGGHGVTAIEQQADRNARFHLEHFQEQLFQPEVGAPIHGSQIVAMVKLAMIEKLLTWPGEVRNVVSTDQPWKRLLPLNGEALQLFQKRAVDERRWLHLTTAEVTLSIIWLRIVSGVWPSAWASKFRMMR